MVGEFHPLQRVADGPSPTRETNGVAVDGSVSLDPSLDCFAWLLIVYNKIENGDQRSRSVTWRSEISICAKSEVVRHMNSENGS